jgi:SMODS-associated and fused to various effectors sensor domain
LTRVAGIEPERMLRLHLSQPITSASAAQSGVSIVKGAVDAVRGQLRPERIELFVAAPAAFAVALGHRWNAMGPTQCHELVAAESSYVPTAVI